jgi:acylphosphatase
MAGPVRRRVVVFGRVQGVFFRDSCQRAAAAAGVVGSVRNRGDGAVEAVFEGDEAAVDRMVAWCRQGPSHARVDRVEVTDEVAQGERSFRVAGWD